MTNIKYNFSIIPDYNNNTEYRKCIRELFFMQSLPDAKFEMYSHVDDESRDELDFDYSYMDSALVEFFKETREHHLFKELYLLAAARLISEDPTIGQAILFSYDYLEIFHHCLVCFFKTSDGLTENNPYYIELKRKLT